MPARRNKPSSFDFKILSPFLTFRLFSPSNSVDSCDGTGVEGNAKHYRQKGVEYRIAFCILDPTTGRIVYLAIP